MGYRLFFFFKQKTAYEMRISDWSSDVCSSDLSLHVYTSDERQQRQGSRDDDHETARLSSLRRNSSDGGVDTRFRRVISGGIDNRMPVQKPMPRFPLIMRCLLIAALDRQSKRLNSSH